MSGWTEWALALAAAGLLAPPAGAQLTDRFTPAPEVLPRTGPRLPLKRRISSRVRSTPR